MKPTSILILLVFFFCGGSIGLLLGQKTATHQAQHINCVPASHDAIDSFYAETLDVTDEQKNLLAPIEEQYLNQKRHYSRQMTEASQKLADIIEQNGYEDTQVEEAIIGIHKAMGSLQHLTIQHLAQVKSVLTTEQAELLKNHVVQRLRQNP